MRLIARLSVPQCHQCSCVLTPDVAATSNFCSTRCRCKHAAALKRISAALAKVTVVAKQSCPTCRKGSYPSRDNPQGYCSAACRSYAEYLDGARFWGERVAEQRGGFVRVDTIVVEASR